MIFQYPHDYKMTQLLLVGTTYGRNFSIDLRRNLSFYDKPVILQLKRIRCTNHTEDQISHRRPNLQMLNLHTSLSSTSVSSEMKSSSLSNSSRPMMRTSCCNWSVFVALIVIEDKICQFRIYKPGPLPPVIKEPRFLAAVLLTSRIDIFWHILLYVILYWSYFL